MILTEERLIIDRMFRRLDIKYLSQKNKIIAWNILVECIHKLDDEEKIMIESQKKIDKLEKEIII